MSRAMGVELEARRVRLERLRLQHAPALFEIAQTPGWPLAGAGLEYDAFLRQLWDASPLQFAVVRKDDDEVIGFTRGLKWDQRSSTMEVVFGIAPAYWRMLWPMEGVVVFCDYLLRGLGLRKLYFELRPSSRAALGSWLQRRCILEWRKTGEVRSPEGELQDVEVWSLDELNTERVDRMLGRQGAGVDMSLETGTGARE